MTEKYEKNYPEICIKTEKNIKEKEICAMERYKRLVHFFSNPDKTLKDLYPFSTYSTSETALECEERDRSLNPWNDEHTSGSDYSVSHQSSHSHYSRTFGLDDPPSRLELKRRPKRASTQSVLTNHSHSTSHGQDASNQSKASINQRTLEGEKRLILTTTDLEYIRSSSHRGSDSGDNSATRCTAERTRKRRRSPDSNKAHSPQQNRDTATNVRKQSITKSADGFSAPQLTDFVTGSSNRQTRFRSPQRPQSSPASYQCSVSRSSPHSSNKLQLSGTTHTSANRSNAQSSPQSQRETSKSSHDTSRTTKIRHESHIQSPIKSRHESPSQSPTKIRPELSHSKHVESQSPSTKTQHDLHSRLSSEATTIRQSKSHGSSQHKSSHQRSSSNQSPTKARLNSLSQETCKRSRSPKRPTDVPEDATEERKVKVQQVRKSRKLKKDESNKHSPHTEIGTSQVSPRNEKLDLYKKCTLKGDNAAVQKTDSETDLGSETVQYVETSSQSFKLPSSLFTPLKPPLINPCIGNDAKVKVPPFTNKDVACILERSHETQKWSVKSSSSWRSTGSDSTDAESLLDLEKFKQAILSVEMPSEYMDPPDETDLSENIFNVLETISESPLEECATVRTPLPSEAKFCINEVASWISNPRSIHSERTLSGSEDLSDIQLHYVYGRKSADDQFELQWIKLEKVGDEGSDNSSKSKVDFLKSQKKKNENLHVCSVNVPNASKIARHGDADASQLATYITLPTQSPQAGDNSVVDIIVLREENLTEEQKAAIKRYRSGIEHRKNRKTKSSLTNCDDSQRSSEPIIIPISDPETNPNSTTGFAVLADWPEVPLSVDVDVKSWLSKSDSEETESVIFVNQCISGSKTISHWASQTLLENASDYNFSDTRDWAPEDELNGMSLGISDIRENGKTCNDDTMWDGHDISEVIECREDHRTERSKSARSSSQHRDSGNCAKQEIPSERPKTAPPIARGVTGQESHGRNYRSKSSNTTTSSFLKRSRGHETKKSSDELQDMIDRLRITSKLEKSKSDKTQFTARHSHKTQEISDVRDRSKSISTSNRQKKSHSLGDDDIQVLFKPKPWQQWSENENERYGRKRNARNEVVSQRKSQRDQSYDRLSRLSVSSEPSKTSCSKRSSIVRPRTASPHMKKDGDNRSGSESASELVLRKRNQARGLSQPKVSTKTEVRISRGIQKDKEKLPKISMAQEIRSTSEQRHKKPCEKNKFSKSKKKDDNHEVQNEVEISERYKGSDTSMELSQISGRHRYKTDKCVTHLSTYLKTISNLRYKCGKKDHIIDVLLEQITSLSLSDRTRKRLFEKVKARLQNESKPHRDYSYNDIIELLKSECSSIEFAEERNENLANKKVEVKEKKSEGSDDVCVCPQDFKIAGSVGCDCLLLTWKSSPRIEEIAGYTVDVDGQLRQRVRSAARTSALLMDLDLTRRMRIALRTQLRSGGEAMCHPPLEIEYEPSVDELWNIGDT